MNLQTELTKLMAFVPVTSDSAACSALLDYAEGMYKSTGMVVERGMINEHPYLYASVTGSKKSKILLQSHIDVVPGTPEMFGAIVDGDKLVGRGAYDMLFALASFNKLAADGDLAGKDIAILLTSDEEIGGVDGVGALIAGIDTDVCILPDAGTHELICSEAKGVLQLVLHIPGVSGHGARPWQTDSPLLKLPEVISAITAIFPNTDQDATTCSLTQVHGGSANNQVPSNVDLVLDIRFEPSDDPAVLQQKVSAAVEPYGVKIDTDVVVGNAYATDLSDPLVVQYLAAHEKLTGTKLGTMRAPGSSDARFMTPKGIPVIMNRPDGGGLHGDNEWVSLSSLQKFHEVLCAYLQIAS